jgi:hypothetical protein
MPRKQRGQSANGQQELFHLEAERNSLPQFILAFTLLT